MPLGGRAAIEATMLRAAEAACDYYLEQSAADGIPYWDTGAPGLAHLGDYLSKPADPFNDYEPVDSSAASVAAQALWRLGNYLRNRPGCAEDARRYQQAALTIARTLFDDPYLSRRPLSSGSDSPLGLSPPQRLGLHSHRAQDSLWGIFPVGRLSRA